MSDLIVNPPSTRLADPGPRILVALDYPDAASALRFVETVSPALCRLKVGKELFVAAGPALLETLASRGFEVFLDLKFHDIPNTVAQACKAAAACGVWMLNVHACGGPKMLAAAHEALAGMTKPPLLIAVTVLTSLDEDELHAVGVAGSVEEQVLRLADLTRAAGLDGVVCSAREAEMLRARCGPGFVLVTPGIRPAGSAAGDQSRTLTPAQALRAGADYLVIGRPVTQAADPQAALRAITDDLHPY